MVYHKDLGGADLHPNKPHTHPGSEITTPVGDSAKLEDSTKAEVRDHTPKTHTHLQGQITDIGGTYVARIVGATADFTEVDFIDDDTERYLDLSGIIPVGTKAVVINMSFLGAPAMFRAFYPVVTGADMFGDGFLPGDPPVVLHLIFPVDETRRIAYWLEPGGAPTFGMVSITGYFK